MREQLLSICKEVNNKLSEVFELKIKLQAIYDSENEEEIINLFKSDDDFRKVINEYEVLREKIEL
mgnify:FL=1